MRPRPRRAAPDIAGTSWDVVVVGAGPAGSMAALEIARRGPSVLLVDKARFPRYRVCGCCLNGRALSLLGSAGLGGLVDEQDPVALCQDRDLFLGHLPVRRQRQLVSRLDRLVHTDPAPIEAPPFTDLDPLGP